MHPNAERVQESLKAVGAEAAVLELPGSTRTAAEAAAAIGTTVERIAKTLVFFAGEEPVLVLASGVARVSLDKLGRFLGAPLRRAEAEVVKRLTGFPIGGVAPVGHPSPLRLLIERNLLRHPEVWAAAGTPHAVFRTSPAELVRITGGEVGDFREAD